MTQTSPSLHDIWLADQKVALCAALLAANTNDPAERRRLERASRVVHTEVSAASVCSLSDTTLALVHSIADFDRSEIATGYRSFSSVGPAVALAGEEIALREAGETRLPAVHLAHAVYLLQQPHLAIEDFLKWLHRTAGKKASPVRRSLLERLRDTAAQTDQLVVLRELLDTCRDGQYQTRERVDAVDRLHGTLCLLISSLPRAQLATWTRICMALRSSLYCWPLMISGRDPESAHGISLPVALFMSPDDRSKVYFKIVRLRAGDSSPDRRFVPPGPDGDGMARMEASALRWDWQWGSAFRTGMEVAKEMWRSQNGRLRFADEQAAGRTLGASLVVDVGAACEIVDAVFDGLEEPYDLSGRSAEAYWVQAVLGLLLPGGNLPRGVVTGRIEVANGAFEIRHVHGIRHKLAYADRAGFSRIILPGREGDELLVEAEADNNPAEQRELVDGEIARYLQTVAAGRSGKHIEINRCMTARAAADAMQPSGWRRAAFVRMPSAQMEFTRHLRRLFVHDQANQRRRMSVEDIAAHKADPWTGEETAAMNRLDQLMLSKTRAISFVGRSSFGDAERAVGKWLAWKDHQTRSADDGLGVRSPGLGVLCVRAAEHDNELRFWSTIADVLCASGGWWSSFQWSGRDGAARLLADLLCNKRADPTISSTSAPDVLVIFDEAGFTQRRTNRIFPDDFRGQLIDLLNPAKDNPGAAHPLNDALLERREVNATQLGSTRIIVVYGGSVATEVARAPGLGKDAMDDLERLAVFRFGFSVQAAFAMLNFRREPGKGLPWLEVNDRLGALVGRRLLCRSRGVFFVRPDLLPLLRPGQFAGDPDAHAHAARALMPILEPRGLFIASNRDRALEPESVLEAAWHLRTCRSLVPARDLRVRSAANAALAALTFLRPYPDWDTVKQLQLTTETQADAVDLARELLELEVHIARRPAHSSRVSAFLNAVGDFAKGKQPSALLAELAVEANDRLNASMQSLSALSQSDARRQKRKLLSELAYCMKSLGVPDDDDRVEGASVYLGRTVNEILSADFGAWAREDPAFLDDFPISRDWLTARWKDNKSPLRYRSTYALVASLLHVGRYSADGEQIAEPWDRPWIEYFTLTDPADFDAAQLKRPIETWNSIYGEPGEAEAFGQRVRDLASHRLGKGTAAGGAGWVEKISTAVGHLWQFIQGPERSSLPPFHREGALKFIRVVSMGEVVPAFAFVSRCGRDFLEDWPRWARGGRAAQSQALGEQVVGGIAGWVSMLASLEEVPERGVAMVSAWLKALPGTAELLRNDPEDLLKLPRGQLEIVDAFRRQQCDAVWHGYQLLGLRDRAGWVISGGERDALRRIVQQIDAHSSSWFLALAHRKAHDDHVVGVSLMLSDVAEEDVLALARSEPLSQVRSRLVRSLPRWIACTREQERARFEALRVALSGD